MAAALCVLCQLPPIGSVTLSCGHQACAACVHKITRRAVIEAIVGKQGEQSERRITLTLCPACSKYTELDQRALATKERLDYLDRKYISELLVCKLCQEPLSEPRQVACGGDQHIYCGGCLTQHFEKQGRSCPGCQKPVPTESPTTNADKTVLKLLDDLRISCRRKSQGCLWTGPRFLLDEHYGDSCDYAALPCSNSSDGCPFHGTRSAMHAHYAEGPGQCVVLTRQQQSHGDVVADEKEERMAREQSAMLNLVNPLEEQVVALNVGVWLANRYPRCVPSGTRFYTTLITLCKQRGSLMATLFGTKRTFRRQPDGCVFLDRNPEAFRYVLEWLRSGVIPHDLSARETLLVQAEARFWQLGNLVTEISSHPSLLMPRASSAGLTPLSPRPISPNINQTPRPPGVSLANWVETLLGHPRSFALPAEFTSLSNSLLGKWVEAYRATRHGFASKEFHSSCGGRGETIVLYQEREGGFVFGGYTAVGWPEQNTHSDIHDEKAFIFTLTNPHQISPTVFPIKSLSSHAIATDPIYGPCFGTGDVYAPHNANSNLGSFDFPHDFVDTTSKGRLLFTGSVKWFAREIVVLTRHPSTRPVPAAVYEQGMLLPYPHVPKLQINRLGSDT